MVIKLAIPGSLLIKQIAKNLPIEAIDKNIKQINPTKSKITIITNKYTKIIKTINKIDQIYKLITSIITIK